MKKVCWILTSGIIFCILPFASFSQLSEPDTYAQGTSFLAKDSSFSMKLRFRFQTLYDGRLNLETNAWNDQLLIRRTRLKFDGYALDPRIVYKVELSLANRDVGNGQTERNGITPNIVLDAAVKWRARPNLEIWFGQTKLPGNRERVISSQQLQFVDRSLLNARFNLDRDIGVQFRHHATAGAGVIRSILSISMGEGRNAVVNNPGGYDYTARVEYLPFGEFTNDGDYFGSDLEREPKPRLSLGITGDFNDNSARSRGQLGKYVTGTDDNLLTTDMTTLMADAMFKYRGFSAASEFARRWAGDATLPFVTGTAFVLQSGYLFRNNMEVAGRYATSRADTSGSTLTDEDHYTFAVSRYLSGHDLKVQTDITYQNRHGTNHVLQYRFQVELAF